MNYYRQCILHKIARNYLSTSPRDFSGEWMTVKQTSWIPEQFAHVGNYVQLKNADGVWDNGWQIDEVGARAPENQVLENSRDWKHQRKASDI